MKKYAVSLNLEIKDTDNGEILDTQTETEYFDTFAEAEQAAARYRADGIAGEYADGTIAAITSAEADPEPRDFAPW